MPTKSHFVLSVQLLIVKTIRQTHANQMLNILFPVIGSHEQEVKSNSACGFSNTDWIFASWTKIHFDPFKWYFNDIRDYMGVQSIFGLFLQLNWKETTFVTSWKNIC
jgi:hypothetical protein